MSHKTKNFYEVLDLKRNCTPEDIKKSFIKLSKEFHPDKNSSKDAHEKFVLINEAYSTLSNPGKKRLYDDHLSSSSKFDFEATSIQKERSYTYRNYDFTAGKNTKNSYHGSNILFRLILLPKAVIVTALVLFTFFSSGLEIYLLKSGIESRKNAMENESIMASIMLARAKRQSELLGREEQLKRLMEGKLGAYDNNDELVEVYKRAKESKRFKSK